MTNINKLNRQRKLFFAVIGGGTGFCFLILSWFIFQVIVIRHYFGSSLLPWENLVIFGMVPMLIVTGAAVPAWALGATIQQSLISGITAMAVFVFVDLSGARNYAPFSEYQTIAFILAAFVSVMTAIGQQNSTFSAGLTSLFLSTIALIGLRFLLPGSNRLAGFSISFVAWIMLPFVAAFFTQINEIE